MKTLTVGQLKEELEEYRDDARVFIVDDRGESNVLAEVDSDNLGVNLVVA